MAADDVTFVAGSAFPEEGRDLLAAQSEARMDAARAALTAVIEPYLTRLRGVTLTRLRGPVARKSTRWWTETKSSGFGLAPPPGPEFKTVDANYVLPDKLIAELESPLREVALRVSTDAAKNVAHALGGRVNPFAIDKAALDAAVEDAVSLIMGVAQHHAEQVRAEILRADSTAESLDEMLDQVEAAYRKGGNWLLMSGNTLATALTNEASLAQARAMGATHKQWLSKKDNRVRPEHRIADRQSRAIDGLFRVGEFLMQFPADPVDLPKSWPVIAGCRCGLSFYKAKPASAAAARIIARQADPKRPAPLAVPRLLAAANGQSPDEPRVLTEPVVGYRMLADASGMEPGRRFASADTMFGLAAPSVFAATAPVLAVLVAAGAAVFVANGAVTLPEGAVLEVVAATPELVSARLVSEIEKAPASES